MQNHSAQLKGDPEKRRRSFPFCFVFVFVVVVVVVVVFISKKQNSINGL